MSEFLAFDVEQELVIRRQVRAACAAIMPAEHVDLVADLAVHATQQALRTLERVCDGTGNPQYFVASLGPALGLVAGRCAQLQEALQGYAAKNGLPQFTSAVQFGEGAG